jgi:Tfp pilus assembly PilM family ATPase
MPEETTSEAARKTSGLDRARRKRYGSRSIIAIDLDGDALRVAVARRFRGRSFRVERVLVERIQPQEADRARSSDPEVAGAWIREVLVRRRLRVSRAVFALPRRHAILRPMSLPSVDDGNELSSMVALQFAKELPFAAEEAVIDFLPLADDANGEAASVEILAAAVRTDVVEGYRRLATAAKIEITGLGLRSHANVRCAARCAPAAEATSGALVSLGADEMLLDVFVGRRWTFSRAVSIGGSTAASTGDAVVDREAAMAAVVTEVARGIRSYEAHGGHRRVDWMAVWGETGRENEVAARLGETLGLEVTVLDPARSPEVASSAREECGAATTAIGLALSASDPLGLPFDFISPKRPLRRRRGITRRRVLAAAALILAAVLGVGLRSRLLAERTAPHTGLALEIETLAAREKVFLRSLRDARAVREWTEARPNWLTHWARLSAIFPPSESVWVTNLSTSSAGLQLAVMAKSTEALADLERRLREAGYSMKPFPVTPIQESRGYGFKTTVQLAVSDALIAAAALPAPPVSGNESATDVTAIADRIPAAAIDAGGAATESSRIDGRKKSTATSAGTDTNRATEARSGSSTGATESGSEARRGAARSALDTGVENRPPGNAPSSREARDAVIGGAPPRPVIEEVKP